MTVSTALQRGVGCHLKHELRAYFRDRDTGALPKHASAEFVRPGVIVVGRRSPNSLYDERIATFEADTVYNQRDAEGFIKLNALRLRLRGGHGPAGVNGPS